jgi:hypothetical protein
VGEPERPATPAEVVLPLRVSALMDARAMPTRGSLLARRGRRPSGREVQAHRAYALHDRPIRVAAALTAPCRQPGAAGTPAGRRATRPPQAAALPAHQHTTAGPLPRVRAGEPPLRARAFAHVST